MSTNATLYFLALVFGSIARVTQKKKKKHDLAQRHPQRPTP